MSEHDPGSEETIFSTALHHAPAERATYLDEACAGQPALRQRIEELLKAQPQLGEFLENPADIGTPGAPETNRRTGPSEERPGSDDGTVRLWNAETGQEMYNFFERGRSFDFPLFSADGTTLAVGVLDPDGLPIPFWRAPSLTEIDELIRTERHNH